LLINCGQPFSAAFCFWLTTLCCGCQFNSGMFWKHEITF
jgi:hypothetical protein